VNRIDNPPTLPDETRAQLARLRELSAKVKAGDKAARRELRRTVAESSPEVVARAADFARAGEWLMIKSASGGEPLTEEALAVRLEHMRAEVAGEEPTPLEVLLAERVVACWFLVELLDANMSAQLSPEAKKRSGGGVSVSFVREIVKMQESAHRRYLSAVEALARVRRLQATTPAVQVNTQVNLVERRGR
jgi:hypothetical protein